MKKFPLLFLLFFTQKTVAQLSGKVLDEFGEPLPFATIYIQNSTKGTTANADGEWRLTLEKGTYRVVFQYVGFRQKIETVEIGDAPKRLTVKLEPVALEIGEVVVRANAEDPAYAIMREVIARRKYFKKRLAQYTCDAYVKGLYRFDDAPKKIFGQDVGNMGGILDSNRTGIVYLSESVSKLSVQAEPQRTREVMISSKVSGDPKGFSFNQALMTNFSLYDERIEIERELLSPLADNAFGYYRFKLLGRFKDQFGNEIAKIEVIPKQPEGPVFSGFLYVVDGQWNLQGADLLTTGAAINQPVLDTLRIRQEFVPAEQPDGWALMSQSLTFRFGVLGFKIKGFYTTVFSNYDLKIRFPEGYFGREIFKIEQAANERDTAYWEKIRPVPLAVEERRDYVKKDSLRQIWDSKTFKDSMDRRGNRFKPMDLLFGYSYSNSFRNRYFSFPGAARWVQFNTVQGWLFNVEPSMRQFQDEDGYRFWRVDGQLNYGFSEKKLRGSGQFTRRFNSINFNTLELGGGMRTAQFNDYQPITPFVNSLYSLFAKQNFLKIYEKTFARAAYSQQSPLGIYFSGAVEFADRKLLQNHSDFSFYKKTERQYEANEPIPWKGNEGILRDSRAFFAEISLRFRFAQQYQTRPNYRSYLPSKWPEIRVFYRKAIPGVGGSTADFDYLRARIGQSGLSAGLVGNLTWSLSGGVFLTKKNLPFVDYRHFNGNQTLLRKSDNTPEVFLLLPYYELSTDQPYAQAHLRHHFEGFFLDRVPLLRKLNWKEVLTINVLQTKNRPEVSRKLPYWEVGFGLENIGFGAFRLFQIDVVSSFYGGKYERTGVVIGVAL